MSVVLGAYTLSDNNLVSEKRGVIAPGNTWEMADGSEVSHVKTTRLTWEYSWEGAVADVANCILACLAVVAGTVSLTPREGGTYTVKAPADSYSVEPMDGSGGAGSRVSIRVVETTA